MNVYDCANELAKAIKESRELQKLQEAKDILAKNADAKKMVDDFIKMSQEVEIAKMQGQEQDVLKQNKLQELYTLLSLNNDAQTYMNAFMRFQMMMGDVNKTIMEPITRVVGEQ
ncbi:MAG: YlbF family regulator [Phascolarctobacterium sp.]|nr:YlbF family regulator [Candidatus Phascolarctobacterium caballi]